MKEVTQQQMERVIAEYSELGNIEKVEYQSFSNGIGLTEYYSEYCPGLFGFTQGGHFYTNDA